MPAAGPTLGEVLPRLLSARGFDTVFGIPGVHTVELYRGLPRSGLTHVSARHEQGAGFMADGYARASGRPAACFVISGPGVTNIATAMGQAYSDSVPMLVISSVLAQRHLGQGAGRLHELPDQSALAAGVAAFSDTVLDPEDLPGVLDRAMALFASGRPRPCHIELPLDVITAPAGAVAEERPAALPSPPAPDPAAIRAAAEMLRAATSPLLILGGGILAAPGAARRLADALAAPAITTIAAKGLLPPGHPLAVGALLPQAAVQAAVSQADVVLALGTELGETDTLNMGGTLSLGGALIRIDIDPAQASRPRRAALAITADAGAAAADLAAALEASGPGGAGSGAARAASLRRRALDAVPLDYRRHGRILDALAEALPGLVIAGDSTQPVYGGNLGYDPAAPRAWFNSATGFGTLGYALPAAIGAAIARPDRPVAALIGDGGLQFTLGELATAAELALPLPILVWNNRGYGEIASCMDARGIPQIGVAVPPPDLQKLAAAFGMRAARPESLAGLQQALRAACEARGPTLIEIEEDAAAAW